MQKQQNSSAGNEYYTGPARTYRDLLVWQKAHKFVLEVYRLTRAYPKDEVNGLAAQTRRAATAVAANIVEGFRKRSKIDKVKAMNGAQENADVCDYYLVLAEDLGYVGTEDARKRLGEVARLIGAYVITVNRRD